jgi:uncharacterized protein YndB with AHSA1/START domain
MTDHDASERVAVHSDFTLERRLDASVDAVFAAWADESAKRSWFAADAESYRLDFTRGGSERVDTTLADGHRVRFDASYHDILASERIVFSAVLSSDDRLATVSLTTVEFVPEGRGTRVVLTEQDVFLDGLERPEWRERGTGSWLDALVRHVEGSAS